MGLLGWLPAMVNCVLHEVTEVRDHAPYNLRVTIILDDGHIAVYPLKYIKVPV
jgi:hypothetical protein